MVFKEPPPDAGWMVDPLEIRCTKCIGCRLDHSDQWRNRISHESMMHPSSYFVTLTYNPEHLPMGGNLIKSDVQKFVRSLRRRGQDIRYFAAGEYGDKYQRPHYHLIVFNLELSDLKKLPIPTKWTLYSSEWLSQSWDKGFVSVGYVTEQSASYVARYCVKKVTGPKAEEHYTRVDPRTNEEYQVIPEFSLMSKKPPIGATWYQAYGFQTHRDDYIIFNGSRQKVPRAYDAILKKSCQDSYDWIKEKRKTAALAAPPVNLAAIEVTVKKRLELLKRTLED